MKQDEVGKKQPREINKSLARVPRDMAFDADAMSLQFLVGGVRAKGMLKINYGLSKGNC